MHQILILIMKKHHKNKFEKHQYVNLGAVTNLQSKRHTRGKQQWDKVKTHKLIADAWDLFSSWTSSQYTDISLNYWSYKKSQPHPQFFTVWASTSDKLFLTYTTVNVDKSRFPQFKCNCKCSKSNILQEECLENIPTRRAY